MVASYNASKTKQNSYQLILRCNDLGIDFIADLPETFSLAAASDWEARMPGSAVAATVEGMSAVAGLNIQFQEATRQVWAATSPIEFSVSLNFDAEENARRDVYEPMVLLQSLVMPSNQNNGSIGVDLNSIITSGNSLLNTVAGSDLHVLFPPGPTVWNKNHRKVSLYLGNMASFDSILVISVNNTFDTKLDRFGYPISGTCEITFRTDMVYSREMYLKSTLGRGGRRGH